MVQCYPFAESSGGWPLTQGSPIGKHHKNLSLNDGDNHVTVFLHHEYAERGAGVRGWALVPRMRNGELRILAPRMRAGTGIRPRSPTPRNLKPRVPLTNLVRNVNFTYLRRDPDRGSSCRDRERDVSGSQVGTKNRLPDRHLITPAGATSYCGDHFQKTLLEFLEFQ